jgi:protein-tyrosine phosphatase
MIDLHCHLLPGIDDGPDTMADALGMARDEVDAGIRTAVATPHVDQRWGVTTRSIGPAVDELRAALAADNIALEVVSGAEVSIGRWMRLDPTERAEAALGDGPYVLVEMPHFQGVTGFDRALRTRLSTGERLILAHPERCPAFHRRPEILASLVGAGALTSVTAGALAGRFGESVRRFSLQLLESGLVHNVASDAHDQRGRPPGIDEGLAAADRVLPGTLGLREWLTVEVPAAVLAGDSIPERPLLAG